MQQIFRLRDVVRVDCGARDMLVGGVVAPRDMHAIADFAGRVHQATAAPKLPESGPTRRVAVWGWVRSRKYLSSRFCAARIR